MKKTLTVLLLTWSFFSNSQCLEINCTSDIVSTADSSGCETTVNYTLPAGYDSCNSDTTVFNYSGIIERFVVPAGITSIQIRTWGASGGNSTWSTLRNGGQGAFMSGTFDVNPGQVLHLLVGQAGESTAVGGGGGGSFVVDSVTQMPLIIAGGGGGASSDMNGVDAVVTQDGTMDSGNLIAGGISGNGGQVCTTLDNNNGGAGAGFYTNGADANSNTVSSNGGFGGQSFLNGGIGGAPGRLDGACSEDAYGGFGGGGSTSCNTVAGGGGGGYSGGAGGAHISNCGAPLRTAGGGGGSFNAGVDPINGINANIGDGKIEIIKYSNVGVTSTLISGIASGGEFPIGTTNQVFVISLGAESDTCSFDITIVDSITPEFTEAINDTVFCGNPSGIQAPAFYDNCSSAISFNLTGATILSGNGDVSNVTFNSGITTVEYIVTDVSGNADTISFEVTVNSLPNITTQSDTILCDTTSLINLVASPSGGVWNGAGVIGNTFNAGVAGNGIHDITYTVSTTEGCTDSAMVIIEIADCAGLDDLEKEFISLYPNPTKSHVNLTFDKIKSSFTVLILDLEGRKVMESNFTNSKNVSVELSNLPNGVYFLYVKTEFAQKAFKLLKE